MEKEESRRGTGREGETFGFSRYLPGLAE